MDTRFLDFVCAAHDAALSPQNHEQDACFPGLRKRSKKDTERLDKKSVTMKFLGWIFSAGCGATSNIQTTSFPKAEQIAPDSKAKEANSDKRTSSPETILDVQDKEHRHQPQREADGAAPKYLESMREIQKEARKRREAARKLRELKMQNELLSLVRDRESQGFITLNPLGCKPSAMDYPDDVRVVSPTATY
jgi:hypothetical protein